MTVSTTTTVSGSVKATNPFPKLTAEAQENEDERLREEIAACLASLAKPRKHSKRYDSYEVIDDPNFGEGGDA